MNNPTLAESAIYQHTAQLAAKYKAQRDELLAAMKAIKITLLGADGDDQIIGDTIWHTKNETLFDYIESEIEKAERSL